MLLAFQLDHLNIIGLFLQENNLLMLPAFDAPLADRDRVTKLGTSGSPRSEGLASATKKTPHVSRH